jgi:hypothetical protein
MLDPFTKDEKFIVTKLMGGWMGGYIDCLQQSKILIWAIREL